MSPAQGEEGMGESSNRICRTVKEYILSEFLPGEDPETLSNDTPLITGGILDSIKVMKLVVFLEETHGLEFQAHEISAEHIDTLERITRIVQTKIGNSE
jgi:acyl carrier protein